MNQSIVPVDRLLSTRSPTSTEPLGVTIVARPFDTERKAWVHSGNVRGSEMYLKAASHGASISIVCTSKSRIGFPPGAGSCCRPLRDRTVGGVICDQESDVYRSGGSGLTPARHQPRSAPDTADPGSDGSCRRAVRRGPLHRLPGCAA